MTIGSLATDAVGLVAFALVNTVWDSGRRTTPPNSGWGGACTATTNWLSGM
jgi:hypothetical protein